MLADQASGSQSTCNNGFVVKVLSRKCAAIKRVELFAVGGASSPGRKEVLFAQAIGQLGHAYYHGARSNSVTASLLRMFVPKPQVLSFALIKDFRRFAAIPCRNGQSPDGRPKRNTLLGDFERDDEPEPDGAVCQICGLGTLIDRLEHVNPYGIEINT